MGPRRASWRAFRDTLEPPAGAVRRVDERGHALRGRRRRIAASRGEVGKALRELDDEGELYDADGAVWLRTTDYGDDKDRVLIRQTGLPTYFLSDIAYHRDKMDRGFEHLIDIWGADHHGYVPRMKADVHGTAAARPRASSN